MGHSHVADPPVVLFQGTLAYKPNTDAANWLVTKIAPRIWESDPSVTVRLAGTPIPEVEALHNPPSVTVVGRVPSMERELSIADIALVPIRFGSGTRVKILESFAHRVPVVSTTIGVEGFDLIDGVHLFIADDPAAFATACHRLLTEPTLRSSMVDAAEQWYLERHEGSVSRKRLQALAREVASSGTG
jgi:glycosyltransferase involved in cell wall biosynthesis